MCAYINLFNNSPQKILLHNTVLIHSFALSLALFFFLKRNIIENWVVNKNLHLKTEF